MTYWYPGIRNNGRKTSLLDTFHRKISPSMSELAIKLSLAAKQQIPFLCSERKILLIWKKKKSSNIQNIWPNRKTNHVWLWKDMALWIFKKYKENLERIFFFFPLYYYFGGRNSLLYFKFSNFIETYSTVKYCSCLKNIRREYIFLYTH